MPTPQWKPEPALIECLLSEPQRYEFSQAMRLLEVRKLRCGSPALHCKGSRSLAFPGSEIEVLKRADDGSLELTAAFMSMLGVGGALPLHYTERLAAGRGAMNDDDGAQAFIEIFSARALPLFFKAWSSYRPEALSDTGFLKIMLALAAATEKDEVQAFYAAILRRPSNSGASMAQMLSAHFGIPLRVEQFAGSWEVLNAETRNGLGMDNCVLGENAALGERIWRRDRRLRLHAGPLTQDDFNRFLPGSDGAAALRTMVRKLSLGLLSCEMRLTLRREDIRGAVLGRGSRLGVDSFLSGAEYGEVRYLLA
ncbi:type VI secretion system baseplate subunit TssG [Pseudoduganella violacea]|uniref:Type VI secretion system protein ImpH n=1 Tax=Pseudoduganella violacea TaxID=1715466 RepID=A0A7W5BBJ8_9BURK|nr:type VI secretion system baseplate subunit TssG [Pseudoduganella violacea]MBB3120114.1 type VI secretion system protein ImpH [Pseudoduganella violacea]